MYYQWAEDINEENKRLRDQACLIGSFWNAEAARKIMNEDENTISTSDEDFEKATKYMIEQNRKSKQKKRRSNRKKKLIFNKKDPWPQI